MLNRESLIAEAISGEYSSSLNKLHKNNMIKILDDLGNMDKKNQETVQSLVKNL
jgi:hypothetical protein